MASLLTVQIARALAVVVCHILCVCVCVCVCRSVCHTGTASIHENTRASLRTPVGKTNHSQDTATTVHNCTTNSTATYNFCSHRRRRAAGRQTPLHGSFQ